VLPRHRTQPFRPRFTLMLLYLALFYVVFALLIALPYLLAAVQTLPPGGAELTPEELELARDTARRAFAGKAHWAALASVLATGAGAWYGKLPGLRPPV
jgi:hypothetical protein